MTLCSRIKGFSRSISRLKGFRPRNKSELSKDQYNGHRQIMRNNFVGVPFMLKVREIRAVLGRFAIIF